MRVLFYVTILALATLLWGYVFYKKDYHPQPLKNLIQIFIFGLFAMLPVYGYRLIYTVLLPDLNHYKIFRPLIDSPFLTGLGLFILNLAILAAVLFTMSAILSAILTFFNHVTIFNMRRAIKEEPLGFAAVSLLIGVVVIVTSVVEDIIGVEVFYATIGSILFLGIIEEYIKHLVVRLTDDKKLRAIDDAITLSIIVGLAFGFLETLLYALMAGNASLILDRALVSLPVHLIASGIFGYYYGLAHFSDEIVEHAPKKQIIFLTRAARFFRIKTPAAFSEEKLAQGLLAATAFHGIANVLFELQLTYITVPLIVLGLVWISSLYKASHWQDKWLRLKTARLRHIGRLLPKLARKSKLIPEEQS